MVVPTFNWVIDKAIQKKGCCVTSFPKVGIFVLGSIGCLVEAVIRAVLATFTSFGLLGYFCGKSENKLFQFSFIVI